MQDRTEHFRFTVDGVDFDFECSPTNLRSYFDANFPNYTLHITSGANRYAMDDQDWYVQYKHWVPSATNPHKGEARIITVELTHLFGYKDNQPNYVHYTT